MQKSGCDFASENYVHVSHLRLREWCRIDMASKYLRVSVTFLRRRQTSLLTHSFPTHRSRLHRPPATVPRGTNKKENVLTLTHSWFPLYATHALFRALPPWTQGTSWSTTRSTYTAITLSSTHDPELYYGCTNASRTSRCIELTPTRPRNTLLHLLWSTMYLCVLTSIKV